MRTNNITLSPSAAVTGVPLAYYDGEWLRIQINRNTVSGPIRITISPIEGGETPTEARIEAAADGTDQILLSPTQLAPQPDGSTWYWTLWAWDANGRPDVQATGTLACRKAIKSAFSPSVIYDLIAGADNLVAGADNLIIIA